MNNIKPSKGAKETFAFISRKYSHFFGLLWSKTRKLLSIWWHQNFFNRDTCTSTASSRFRKIYKTVASRGVMKQSLRSIGRSQWRGLNVIESFTFNNQAHLIKCSSPLTHCAKHNHAKTSQHVERDSTTPQEHKRPHRSPAAHHPQDTTIQAVKVKRD